MEFVYLNNKTASAITVNIELIPYGNIEDTIHRASKRFIDALFHDHRNEKSLEKVFDNNMFELILTKEKPDYEWLRGHLFAKWVEKKHFIDMHTNALFTSHAEGLKASLYMSEDERYVKVHYITHVSAKNRLVEITDPTMYHYLPPSHQTMSINVDKYLNGEI